MTKFEEIEKAIESLPETDYGLLREWFLERDWERWDRQIEADSASGKLDFLIEEARIGRESRKLGKLDASHD